MLALGRCLPYASPRASLLGLHGGMLLSGGDAIVSPAVGEAVGRDRVRVALLLRRSFCDGEEGSSSAKRSPRVPEQGLHAAAGEVVAIGYAACGALVASGACSAYVYGRGLPWWVGDEGAAQARRAGVRMLRNIHL